MVVRTLGAIAVMLALAGCGTEKKQAAADTQSTSTAACQPLAGGGTTSRTGPGTAEAMYLTDVNAERLECADRISFQFRQDQPVAPGYQVAYQPGSTAKIEDGSGNAIEIEGSAFLVVKLQPAATAETTGDTLKLTYTGPRHVRLAGGRHAIEVVKTGDFENVVTWVIGLDEQRPFTAKSSDSQLVVDVG
jgi:hypothetical protein